MTFGVLLAAATAACGGSDDPRSAPVESNAFEVPEASEVAEEQRQYFDDGVVSVAEYHEAFGRFRQCAIDVGGVVSESSRDAVTGVIKYSSSSPLEASGAQTMDESGNVSPTPSSPVNDCYQRFFDLTELTFQLNDPAVQAAMPEEQLAIFGQVVEPCLTANGVEVPDDLEYGTPEYQDLSERFGELSSTGACDAVEPAATNAP